MAIFSWEKGTTYIVTCLVDAWPWLRVLLFCRFQYVLAAATSIATKVNEETLTYLNQGQPYEIKLKKLGELTAYRGVVFRSVVRLCFHDRRLQFSEREQITQWEDSHMNDRILQVDLPLSYGVTMLPHQTDIHTNTVSFLWEPLKEVGLYVKVCPHQFCKELLQYL